MVNVQAKRREVMPIGGWPRGLSRVEAATYIGISTRLFDEMVEDGRMPRPKCINARRVWDRLAVDAAFISLTEDAEKNPADEDW